MKKGQESWGERLKLSVWPWAALCLWQSSDRWWRGWWFCRSRPWDSRSRMGSALSPPLHTPPLFLWCAILNMAQHYSYTFTHIQTYAQPNLVFIFLHELSRSIHWVTEQRILLQKRNMCPVKWLDIVQCNTIMLLFLLHAAHRCLILGAVGHRAALKAGTVHQGAVIDKVMTTFKWNLVSLKNLLKGWSECANDNVSLHLGSICCPLNR